MGYRTPARFVVDLRRRRRRRDFALTRVGLQLRSRAGTSSNSPSAAVCALDHLHRCWLAAQVEALFLPLPAAVLPLLLSASRKSEEEALCYQIKDQ